MKKLRHAWVWDTYFIYLKIYNCLKRKQTTTTTATETFRDLLSHPSHMQDSPLATFSYIFYTDGCYFLSDNHCVAEYAMVWDDAIVKATSLPTHTISWQAQLVSLNRAFHIVENAWLMVYTDSIYAFHILLTHSVIWKNLGFLNTKGNLTTNSSYKHDHLGPSLLSSPVAMIHCKAHQTAASNVSKDKNYTFMGTCQVILPSFMMDPTFFQATPLYNQ